MSVTFPRILSESGTPRTRGTRGKADARFTAQGMGWEEEAVADTVTE